MINQSLALTMIGSLAPQYLVSQLHKQVVKLALYDANQSLIIRKKALLCLLRIFRKYKEEFDPLQWVKPIERFFEMKMHSLGFINSICAFIIGVTNL